MPNRAINSVSKYCYKPALARDDTSAACSANPSRELPSYRPSLVGGISMPWGGEMLPHSGLYYQLQPARNGFLHSPQALCTCLFPPTHLQVLCKRGQELCRGTMPHGQPAAAGTHPYPKAGQVGGTSPPAPKAQHGPCSFIAPSLAVCAVTLRG